MGNYRILEDGFTVELNPESEWVKIGVYKTPYSVETSYQDKEGNVINLDQDNEFCSYVSAEERKHISL